MRKIEVRMLSTIDNQWEEFDLPQSLGIDVEIYLHREDYRLETMGQYTGLKDKNGVKIYEGDIVRNENGIQEVYYDEDNISFQMGLSDSVLDQEVGFHEPIEVIGNIYENPKLKKRIDPPFACV